MFTLRFQLSALAFFTLLTANVQANDNYWVGLASFMAHSNAERFVEKFQKDNDSPVSLMPVDINGKSYLRALAGPYPTEQAARQAATDIQRSTNISTWFVKTQTPLTAIRQPASPAEPELTAQSTKPETVEPPARVPETSFTPPPSSPAAEPKMIPVNLAVNAVPGEKVHLSTVAKGVIKIDGHVDEAEWRTAKPIDDFVTLEPATLVPGKYPTVVRFLYNEEGLYFSAIMRQPVDTLVKRLTGRDVRDNRDRIGITIDTSGQGLYGFWFGVMLGDSIMDGTVLPERIFASDWDGPWRGRSQTLDDGWSAEMFIPWGIVSMPATDIERTMGMYISRNVAHLNENWGWPSLPPTQAKFMSAMQPLVMSDVKPRQQYSIYPFAATAFDWVDDEPVYRAGADIFWRPSSNFQLNATVNPDFGNVESDDVVINFTATETFFPEKRLFFLEGQEIFSASPRADTRSSSVGNQGAPYTMVNTRRIGGKPLAPALTPGMSIAQRELVQPTELYGAVKTTGQVGDFRYGVMGAFEEEVKFDVVDAGQPRNLHQAGNDYGIARFIYQNSDNGSYKGLGFLSTAVLNDERGDALVQGVDWHYLSAKGSVKIDGQVMSSDLDRIEDRGYGGFLDFEFTYADGVKHRVGLEYFDENIDINDLGFLSRNDEYRLRSAITLTNSNLSWAKQNQLDIRGFVEKNISESLRTNGGIFISNRTDFRRLSQLVVRLGYFPAGFDDLNSFGNGTFRVEDRIDFGLQWSTDTTKPLSFSVGAGYAEDDLGDPGYSADFSLNWRPSYRFGMKFGVKYREQDAWLLHRGDDLFATFEAEQLLPNVSIEYFISARQQLRMSLQWVGIKAHEKDFYRIPATPDDLIAIAKPAGSSDPLSYDFSVSQYALQLRYRWEMAPLSDLFIVYTRQANVATALGEAGFNDIFDNAWRDPLADVFVMKIRYRFGS